MKGNRTIKAPTGTSLSAKSWLTEAPLRMIMNNLDPDVAERPEDLEKFLKVLAGSKPISEISL